VQDYLPGDGGKQTACFPPRGDYERYMLYSG
jgi:hypothetical protein